MFWDRISEEDARSDFLLLHAEQGSEQDGADGEARVEVIDNYKQKSIRLTSSMSSAKETSPIDEPEYKRLRLAYQIMLPQKGCNDSAHECECDSGFGPMGSGAGTASFASPAKGVAQLQDFSTPYTPPNPFQRAFSGPGVPIRVVVVFSWGNFCPP
eukprot:6451591-Pyramimonas_sp.AAC.1